MPQLPEPLVDDAHPLRFSWWSAMRVSRSRIWSCWSGSDRWGASAVLLSDGGGRVVSALNPIHGASASDACWPASSRSGSSRSRPVGSRACGSPRGRHALLAHRPWLLGRRRAR